MGLLKQLLDCAAYRRNIPLQPVFAATLDISSLSFAYSRCHIRSISFCQPRVASRAVKRQLSPLSQRQFFLLPTLRPIASAITRPIYNQSNTDRCKPLPGLFRYNNLANTHARLFHSSYSNKRNDEISTTTSSIKNPEKSATNEPHSVTLIETWFYEVSPYGSLEAVLPFRTEIQPLPVQEYPNMNKVIIQLHFDTQKGTEVPNSHQLSEISDLYALEVGFDQDKANMKISCEVTPGVELPIVCTLQVPLKCDLKINMVGDQSISIQKMESSVISIESEKGDCHLNSIKCGSVSAVCRAGSIQSKGILLGNIHFHTGKSGTITTDKLQGTHIFCETEMGSVNVKSMYAENAIFRSDAGVIHLGHCHGQLYMQADRSVFKIDSLEGDLDIGLQSGSVEAHLSHHMKANIEVKTGDISLSFPEGVSTDLNLDCRAISVNENVRVQFKETGQPHHKEGHIGEKGKALVNARTLSGTVHLKLLDWIETTKLSFKETDES